MTRISASDSASDDDTGPLCVIARGWLAVDVDLVVAAMRGAGYHAVALDRAIHGLHPDMALAMGGMRIAVPASQVVEASEFLAALPAPVSRMPIWRLVVFCLLVWWWQVPPVPSAIFLRDPEAGDALLSRG
ncbi:MAG: hypothetical protein Q4G25_00135 [Paracoccus sp. (in: a-proteobacteria)]|nr:hypothetical protein [Paracoccus sp. (in: a-proteobacteria)]